MLSSNKGSNSLSSKTKKKEKIFPVNVEKEVVVVHRGTYNNNTCIIVVDRDVSTAYC